MSARQEDDDDDDFSHHYNSVHASYELVQRMIDFALKRYEGTILSRGIYEVIEKRITTLLNDANQLVTKGIQNPVYGSVERSISQTMHLGAVDKTITKMIRMLAESDDFIQSLLCFHMETPNFTVPITRLVGEHVAISVFNKQTVCDQSVAH